MYRVYILWDEHTNTTAVVHCPNKMVDNVKTVRSAASWVTGRSNFSVGDVMTLASDVISASGNQMAAVGDSAIADADELLETTGDSVVMEGCSVTVTVVETRKSTEALVVLSSSVEATAVDGFVV